MEGTQIQKLRVVHFPQVGCGADFIVPVNSFIEGCKVMNLLAAYDLFQLQHNIKPDFANATILEVWNATSQEWEDWYYESETEFHDNPDSYLRDHPEVNKEVEEYEKALFVQIDFNKIKELTD